MKTEQILILVVVIGCVFLAGHIQSRLDTCKRLQQKTIGCVLQL
jgi:hypothetical protein